MDRQTADRLDHLENKMNALDERVVRLENILDKLNHLLKKQGLKPGKNFDAP